MEQIPLNAKIEAEHRSELDLISAFFEQRQSGYFLDVGTNMPTVLNQTYELEQAGWSGLLFEPQPSLETEIRAKRRAKLYQIACGPPEHDDSYMRLHLLGGQSSLRPGTTARQNEYRDTVEVPVRTLDSVLEAEGVDKVDFVSIDVEGFELDVLRGFSLSKYRPDLILIEDHVRKLELHRYLAGQGYRLIERTFLNNWYVPRSAHRPVPLKTRVRLFRKMYLGTPVRALKHALKRP
jgi:FkbM family methyltransferase